MSERGIFEDTIIGLARQFPLWEPIETAPKGGSIVWVANDASMCPAYFYVDAWRNWFKGPRYENVKLGDAAFAPEEIWFEPTHWQPLPELPGTDRESSAQNETRK